MARGGLYPVGWCSSHKVQLSVPPDLVSALKDEDSVKQAKEAVAKAEKESVSVPEDALNVEGYTAVDRIKQDMKVEVKSGEAS